MDNDFHIEWPDKPSVTYGEIFDEYRKNRPPDAPRVLDYRPCYPPYFTAYIPNTIIIWLDQCTDEQVIFSPILYTYKGENK